MRKLVSCIIPFLFISSFSFAQNEKTTQFALSGPCIHCGASRIDSTLKAIPGAISAKWDESSGMLTVRYDGSKTSPIDLQLELSFKGYNAGDFDYTPMPGLPACCVNKPKPKPIVQQEKPAPAIKKKEKPGAVLMSDADDGFLSGHSTKPKPVSQQKKKEKREMKDSNEKTVWGDEVEEDWGGWYDEDEGKLKRANGEEFSRVSGSDKDDK